MRTFSPETFRGQFPALEDDNVYLDSAATSLTPHCVSQATQEFYRHAGTVHRSQHKQARELTERYEGCRQQVANLIGAAAAQQIIWTRGTTESINLVAQSWLAPRLQPGDEILVSELEHHANLLPWLMLAEKHGAKVVCWRVDSQGRLDATSLGDYLTAKTRLVAVSQMSNVTGFAPELSTIIDSAHRHGVPVLVDGAQGIVHHPMELGQLKADFYAFSAHKLYGPTGIGVLYARADRLAEMQPVQGGGKMISQVSFSGYQLLPPPWCFEPGTPNSAGVIGLASALTFRDGIDWSAAESWAVQLAQETAQALAALAGIRLFRAENSPILSLAFDTIHDADLVSLVTEQGIALRGGQHCAQPLIQALGVRGTLRVAFAPYNSRQDVERVIKAITLAYQLLVEE